MRQFNEDVNAKGVSQGESRASLTQNASPGDDSSLGESPPGTEARLTELNEVVAPSGDVAAKASALRFRRLIHRHERARSRKSARSCEAAGSGKPAGSRKHAGIRKSPAATGIPPKAVGFNLGGGMTGGGTHVKEGLLNICPRTLVPDEDVLPQSPCRAVVKTITTLDNGTRIFGTGVVIDPSLVVVAAHLLLDELRRPAVRVEVHAGYGSRNVESHYGVYAVVHYKWYSKGSAANDIGLISLDGPFSDNVTPFNYRQTPISDGDIARVLGYPCDFPPGARGAHLCVSESPFWYDEGTSYQMLEHVADTNFGTSGGAVLDINGELIAVHSGQLWDELGPSMNTAVTINRYGNDLESFTGLLYFMALEEVNRREKGGEEGLIGNDWCPTWSKKLKGGQWARNHGRAYGW